LLACGTRDGASAATLPLLASGAEQLVFPYVVVTESWYTGITLVNPDQETAQVRLKAFAEDGTWLGQSSFQMESRTKFARLLSGLIGGVDAGRIRFLQVESTQPLIGFELFGSFFDEGLAGMPAIPAGGQDLTRQAIPEPPAVEKGSPAQAPSVPTGLQGWGRSGSEICLTWCANPADEGVTGYRVYMLDGTFVRPVGNTSGIHLTVAGLRPSTTYRFYIKAVNQNNVVSGNSPLAGAKTLAAGQTEGCYRLLYNSLADPGQYLHGFTVSSLDGVATSLQLQLYNAAGARIWAQTVTLSGREQFTRLLDGLVPAAILPGAAYLRAVADVRLLGFQLYYNSAGSGLPFHLDGLPSAGRGAQRLILPVFRAGEGWDAYLELTNVASGNNPVTVEAWSADGVRLGAWSATMAGAAHLRLGLEALFHGLAGQIGVLDVRASGPVVPDLWILSPDGTRVVSYLGLVVHNAQP